MSAMLLDFPADVRAAIEPHVRDPAEALAAIGVQIAAKRDEAKSARAASGIENTWRYCEEAYVGMDDANRGEFEENRMQKATTRDGPVSTGDGKSGNQQHRSTVFIRLTSRYVDAGAAKLAEILLPANDKAFSFNEMPVPELIDASEDHSQVVHSDLGEPLTRPLRAGETPPAPPPPAELPQTTPDPAAMAAIRPGDVNAPSAAPPVTPPGAPGSPGAPQAPQRVPLSVKDLAMEKIEMARKKAKAAETRIDDWMRQTQYRAELRKVIADSARLGVGVLKGPIPRAKKVMAILENDDGSVDLAVKETIVPATKHVSPWNIYPDAACGENIHNGDHCFERDFMSGRQVRGLKKLPGYIASAIDRVLEEGPDKANSTGDARTSKINVNKNRYEVWYFYGTLSRDEVATLNRAAGKRFYPEDIGDVDTQSYVIVTLINDSVVRCTVNPLDSGEFPYHSMPWQRRADHWAGVGVGEQMTAPQKITNAAVRALLNNGGKSAGSQFIIDMAAIRPADGNWTITPDKIWELTGEGTNDVRQAFMAVQIPNVTAQLMTIVTLGERMAEETTSIPLITQGQSGATTPDTFGGAKLQDNNANQLLRSIGYVWDDQITEPVVRQFYEWLLLDPNVPNECKGEFQIDAHGSIALVERAIQDQTIAQMGSMAASPIYGIDPKKWSRTFIKSKRLQPPDLMYSDEDQARIDAAPPAEAPVVTAAKIAADVELKKIAAKQSTDERSAKNEQSIAEAANSLEGGHVQNDAARIAAEQERTHVEATLRLHEIQAKHDLAILEYANQHRISLDAARVQLARTSMELQTQRDLNAANTARDLHKHHNPAPPVQAPGRAAPGHAFDQAEA